MKNAPVRAGALTERIVIERIEAEYIGDYANTAAMWETLHSVRAELLDCVVSEEPANRGSRITTTASFAMRYVPDVKATDRLKWNGDVFDIVGLKTLGRMQGLQIDCRRIGT